MASSSKSIEKGSSNSQVPSPTTFSKLPRELKVEILKSSLRRVIVMRAHDFGSFYGTHNILWSRPPSQAQVNNDYRSTTQELYQPASPIQNPLIHNLQTPTIPDVDVVLAWDDYQSHRDLANAIDTTIKRSQLRHLGLFYGSWVKMVYDPKFWTYVEELLGALETITVLWEEDQDWKDVTRVKIVEDGPHGEEQEDAFVSWTSRMDKVEKEIRKRGYLEWRRPKLIGAHLEVDEAYGGAEEGDLVGRFN